MCYGRNCGYEGANGTCGITSSNPEDYPCHYEPEEIEETLSFYITTEIAKTIKHNINEDSWDTINNYVGSPEFWEDLMKKKPNFDFEES